MLTIALLVVACGTKPKPDDPRSTVSVPGQEILPSGLRILLDPEPSSSVVALTLFVTRGSVYDPEGKGGLSRLVQRLTDRAVDAGSGGYERRERLVEMAAAHVAGQTGWDTTAFRAVVPRQRLSDVLKVEAARLATPLAGIDDTKFAAELRALAADAAQPREGDGINWEVVEQSTFPPGHRYARSPWGTPESRRALSLEDARRFADDNYRPENFTLVLAGAVTPDDLQAVIRALPLRLRDAEERPRRPESPASASPLPLPPPAPRLVRQVASVRNPELLAVWTLPGIWRPGEATAEVLYGAWRRRLANLLDEPQITNATGDREVGLDASAWVLKVVLTPNANPEEVLEAVERWTESLGKSAAPLRRDLTDVRHWIATWMVLGGLPWLPRAENKGLRAALTGEVLSPSDRGGRALAVDDQAIVQLARRYLGRGRAHFVLRSPAGVGNAGPSSRPSDLPAPPLFPMRVAEPIRGAGSWNITRLRELFKPSGLSAATTTTLPNGLTVILLRHEGQAARALLGFRGGYASAQSPLLAEAAMRLSPRGEAAAIDLGMLMDSQMEADCWYRTIAFQSEQLPAALTLLFDAGRSTVEGQPTEKVRRWLLFGAQVDPIGEQARATFWRALFGDHPYGRTSREIDWPGVTQATMNTWLKTTTDPRNAALVVTGDVDPDDLQRTIAALTRDWSAGTGNASPPVPPVPRVRRLPLNQPMVILTDRPPTRLVEIRLGCLLPSSPADAHARSAALGEAMARGIADELGFEVDWYNEWCRGGAANIRMGLNVTRERLGPILAALRRSWNRWGQQGLSEAESNVGRWLAAAKILSRHSLNDAERARDLFEAWMNERALDSIDAAQAELLSFQAKDLSELFAVCRANTVLSIVGEEAVARLALRYAWPEAKEAR